MSLLPFLVFFFLMIRRPPRSTLFPYPTLSRSRPRGGERDEPILAALDQQRRRRDPADHRLHVPRPGEDGEDRARCLEKGRMRPWHLLALARDGDVGRDDLRRHARRVGTAERERLADEPLGTEPRGPPADELLPHTGEHIGRERERDGGIDHGTPWPRLGGAPPHAARP